MRGNANCSEMVTTLLRIVLYVSRLASTAGLFSMKSKSVDYMRVYISGSFDVKRKFISINEVICFN